MMTKPIKLKNSLKFRAALAVDSEYAIIGFIVGFIKKR